MKNILIILVGLTGLFTGLDFLMNASSLSSFNMKILYMFSKWEESLNLLYPLALVFALIWTNISFIKQNTIASFYALGLSRREFAKPFLWVAIGVYLLFIALNFTSFSTAKDRAVMVKKQEYGVSKTEDLFFKYDDSFVYIKTLIPEQFKIENLTIFKLDEGKIVETYSSKEAWYNIHEWVASDVVKKSKVLTADGDEYLKIEHMALLHTLKNYQPKILTSIYDEHQLTLYESIKAKRLLENQGLSTDFLVSNIYSKVFMPLFSVALVMILLFTLPFHARYMNLSFTTMKALGGTLFVWGILFALQGMGKSGALNAEMAIILPVLLLFFYAFYTYKKSDNLI